MTGELKYVEDEMVGQGMVLTSSGDYIVQFFSAQIFFLLVFY